MIGIESINIPHPDDVPTKDVSISRFEWYKDLIFYLKFGKISIEMSSKESRASKMKTNQYVFISRTLFRRNFDGVLLRLLNHLNSHQVLQEFHGVCGGHFAQLVAAHRIIGSNYY
jgi:hypothetical protein